ncbi:fungal cellulose binding domain protein [Colletotrichum musicola]|uniref:lytic cellulose monooxygenase (C4-dehydrogenating) n=1 Tax=Colletotrichum musicola TaxID=2175873 RepID=A0A8H6N279_9PEZI|nr:fungal cellulose binding domain protein [Colletotrichum musicola]
MKFSAVAAVAALAPSFVSAHYFFPHLYVNGVKSAEYEYVRRSTQGFQPHFGPSIMSSNDMRCNTGSQANATRTKIAKVKAGDTIGFGTNLGAQIQHPGPIQVYMSKAPGAVTSYDGSGDWFKIYQLGPKNPLTADVSSWKVYNKNRIDFAIPKDIPAGQYLVRIEHIGLHRPSGTEMYFNCAHVEVSNTGGSLPRQTAKIPGMYKPTDAGIKFSIYGGAKTYPFPGPALISSGKNAKREEEVEERDVDEAKPRFSRRYAPNME